MAQEPETQEVGRARIHFIFRIVPISFFVVISRIRIIASPEEEFGILPVSEAEFVFLRRVGVPEVMIMM